MKKIEDLNRAFDFIKEGTDLANQHAVSDKVDIRNATLKVMEESGELAAEILKMVGHKKSKVTKEKLIERIKSEGVDTLIAILDVLNLVDISKEEIINLTEIAVQKWKNKHILNKE